MLPTPSTSHITFDNIYEPAEDSYFLLDTLSSPSETVYLKARFPENEHHVQNPPVVLEVGTGSGVVLAFVTAHAARIFGRQDVLTFATDINVFASHGARQTIQKARRECIGTAGIFSDVMTADLSSAFRSGTVDILIFNPPYVPTEAIPDLAKHAHYNELTDHPRPDTFERDSHLLSLSYAGGADGMEITNRLLEQLPRILHPVRGVAYILLCAQNNPEEVIRRMTTVHDLVGAVVALSGKKAGWEKLCIIRLARR